MMKKLTAIAVMLTASLTVHAGDMAKNTDKSATCPQKEYAMGLRYFQQSAEVVALQKQAYNLATARFDDYVNSYKAFKGEDADLSKLAIITDVDETVIDNSELIVRDMNACHEFTTWDTWKVWEREGQPKLIPGALEFLSHVNKTGVSIYYVSNRYQENKSSTLATLKQLKLPQVNDAHVLLYGPPKTERRASVKKDHILIMQLGDSLHDFSGDFAKVKRDMKKSRALVKKNSDKFGTEYIVFPNSTYGYWSKAKLNAWTAPLKIK